MAAVVAGLLPLTLAYIIWRRNQLSPDVLVVRGVVVEEVKRRSRSRPRTWMFAPVLSYRHPGTGREAILEPGGYSNLRYEIGQNLDVAIDPKTGDAMRVPERPVLEVLVPALLGVAMIVGGIITIVR